MDISGRVAIFAEMTRRTDLQRLNAKFTDFLRNRRLRKTPERYAILKKAVELSAHFGVDDLYSALEKEGYHVSRATVYNTLELFCEAAILNRHLFDTSLARYELACASHHLHLICRRCGRIREIEDDSLAAEMIEQKYPGFQPEYSSSIVYGICEICSGNRDPEEKP